jgi:hypothetical protein
MRHAIAPSFGTASEFLPGVGVYTKSLRAIAQPRLQ